MTPEPCFFWAPLLALNLPKVGKVIDPFFSFTTAWKKTPSWLTSFEVIDVMGHHVPAPPPSLCCGLGRPKRDLWMSVRHSPCASPAFSPWIRLSVRGKCVQNKLLWCLGEAVCDVLVGTCFTTTCPSFTFGQCLSLWARYACSWPGAPVPFTLRTAPVLPSKVTWLCLHSEFYEHLHHKVHALHRLILPIHLRVSSLRRRMACRLIISIARSQ